MYKVTPKILPTCIYTLAPVILLLVEASLKVFFWYCYETCICMLLIFFYTCKMMTPESNLESWEEL